ncbi:MAG: RHS repeat-associated core domain-containing protein [Pirellulales bacterium]
MTNLGSSGIVDDSVLRIGTEYDDVGRVSKVTSYSDTAGNTPVNQVEYVYNGGSKVAREYEEHNGTVDRDISLFVQYDYEDGAVNGVAKYVRLTGMTYPNGRQVDYGYGATGAIDDVMSRLATIGDGSVINARYKYLGAKKIVTEDYQDAGVKLDYAANNFAALDRFGRVLDQVWTNYGASPAVELDHISYTYGRAGNRISRDNAKHAAFDEDYAYDALDRLESVTRANGFDQAWTLDGLGNWSEFDQDADGNGVVDLAQPRSTNAANEITEIDATTGIEWPDAQYDAAGNMTTLPLSRSDSDPTSVRGLSYDAWNRVTSVGAFGVGTAATYRYDGLGRRIVKDIAGDTSDVAYYYNQDWQLLEERKLGLNGSEDPDPLAQYVWSPTYIDALAVRYWDGNADGDFLDANEGAQYYLRDANFNVTAVVNADATVLERYNYTPYGEVTFLEPDFDVASIQYSTIGNSHLYTGREHDAETGLQLNRQRYYASWLGSWVTRDPVRYRGGINLYSYCGDTPVGVTDPRGQEAMGRSYTYDPWLNPFIPPGFPPFGPTPAPLFPPDTLKCPRTPRPPCDEVAPWDLIDEANKRRGSAGPGDDSSHHCWAACMCSQMGGGAFGLACAVIETLTEFPPAFWYGWNDSTQDIAANFHGFGAGSVGATTCPSKYCDEQCGSHKHR